jgi:hypothetical protein
MMDITNVRPEDTCFVISPIGEEKSEVRKRSDMVLKHIISPAAKEHKLRALRSDHISIPGMITTQIINHIINDRIVVADLTDQNPNVFYELALRHAFKKPIIQLVLAGQKLPFDVHGTRTIQYDLNLDAASDASEAVSLQIGAALQPDYESDSPVSLTAKLEDLSKSKSPEYQPILQSVLDQLDSLNKRLSDMGSRICSADTIKDALPPLIKDQVHAILQQYAEEISLLKSVRYAGVTGIYKRREIAIKAFARALDEESREIMVVGSSLKGLLQKEEYKDIATKLQFKSQKGLTRVKFILTHPIVADFRASQENRRPTEIGLEIIKSLEVLREWGIDCADVRLYLGTPTCFAIKTTRQMLINPYPYISVSFDSPCFIVEFSSEGGTERPGYFFDEFNSRHFGAWDTDLSVHIYNYDTTIKHCKKMLNEYAASVQQLISKGKTFE